MRPSPAARRGSRRSRSARSSRWPVRFRLTPTVQLASGAPGNWPMRSCVEGSSTASLPGTLGGYSKGTDLKPHLIRYWLTPAVNEDQEEREEKIADVCEVYREAPARAKQGERTVSSDEMTGVQALERAAPGLPMARAKVERREFEYVRHGTRTFIVNFDVVSGVSGGAVCSLNGGIARTPFWQSSVRII